MTRAVTDKHTEGAQHVGLEYSAAVGGIEKLTAMYWVGYGIFVALNSFLMTSIGFIYSSAVTKAKGPFLDIAPILISTIGIFVAVASITTARSIHVSTLDVLRRGIAIEQQIGAELLTSTARNLEAKPIGTYVGGWLFLLFWLTSFALSTFQLFGFSH